MHGKEATRKHISAQHNFRSMHGKEATRKHTTQLSL
jgi:hypothetical protein